MKRKRKINGDQIQKEKYKSRISKIYGWNELGKDDEPLWAQTFCVWAQTFPWWLKIDHGGEIKGKMHENTKTVITRVPDHPRRNP